MNFITKHQEILIIAIIFLIVIGFFLWWNFKHQFKQDEEKHLRKKTSETAE